MITVTNNSVEQINAAIIAANREMKEAFNKFISSTLYPIDSIYMTTSNLTNFDPKDVLGFGKWKLVTTISGIKFFKRLKDNG